MMQTWKPIVVETASACDSLLDITAKVNEKITEMTLYVANMSEKEQPIVVTLDHFKMKSVTDAQVIGSCELTAYNTYDKQNNVVFRPVLQVKTSGNKIKA